MTLFSIIIIMVVVIASWILSYYLGYREGKLVGLLEALKLTADKLTKKADPANKSLDSLFGKWPGDETDEELAAAIKGDNKL